ncbi:MAG: acetyl/propionyl/methylcrotonyl-CoA carboxylase subunit alpha [Paracoccaceae bacterium]
MFDTILIANRGEIACRVMQTARALGVKTVAVHSDIDKGALHVEMADHAVSLGGRTPAESYLRGVAIIEAALKTGAQAIHPGYGFLSENPDFVDAVEAAGLVFIGPSGDAIRAMGLKDAAKKLMIKAGVPVVPGYHGDDQSNATLTNEAARIGYPVLIKAVAGGGGKGMRLVEAETEFLASLASAQSEAKAAFGNSDVLIEKFVAKPRHIEVQVFGDGSDAVHLFERDCSLQRRHQKVIEEAPAPGMTDTLRHAMCQAAVTAAKAIGYSGAGTIEFIVDSSDGLQADRFWFMEMNTRLQVEHPVTEAITGVDLVEWQLRVAAGESLQSLGTDVQIQGHAFEARLYAEDVPSGFLPATGTLSCVRFPIDARSDSGVRAGDMISPFYDPMIAKITVHGPTRDIALARLRRALAQTAIAGTTTNVAFLGALARHSGFAAGDVDTGLIGRDLDALTARPEPTALQLIAAGMAVANLNQPDQTRGFHLWQPLSRTISVSHGDEPIDLKVSVKSATHQDWTIGDTVYPVFNAAGVWSLDGEQLPETFADASGVTVFGSEPQFFGRVDLLDVLTNAGGDDDVITAPMPGLVKTIFAKPAQSVCKGDPLAILEAMKMEHTLAAARDGVVSEVCVKANDQVEAGAFLVRLEAEDADT